MVAMIDKSTLIIGLYELGAIRFGTFMHGADQQWPVQIDLWLLTLRPGLLRRAARILQAISHGLRFDWLASTCDPSTLPVAVVLSMIDDRPLIAICEPNEYGPGQLTLGMFEEGDLVLLIGGVMSDGQQQLEAIHVLEAAGLRVSGVLVVIDLEQGGMETFAEHGYRVNVALSLPEIADTLAREGYLDPALYAATMEWIQTQAGYDGV
jgi:uridine monophosphate synthetase